MILSWSHFPFGVTFLSLQIFKEREEDLRRLSRPLACTCFRTSIWDETLYKVLNLTVHIFIYLFIYCQSGKNLTLLSLLCCFLPGDLEGFRKNPFPMKEGVEYRIKICFKVRVWCLSHSPLRSVYVAVLLLQHCWRCNCSLQSTIIIVRGFSEEFNSCCLLQVNKEIVSGLKYMQQTFRKGVKGEPAQIISLCCFFGVFL